MTAQELIDQLREYDPDREVQQLARVELLFQAERFPSWTGWVALILVVLMTGWVADHVQLKRQAAADHRKLVQAEDAATSWRCKFNLIDPIRAEAGVPLDDDCKEVLFGRKR